MTDYPDWGVPQANATAISTTGVPLLHAATALSSGAGQVIAAAGSASTGVLATTQPSYELRMYASGSGVATVPFVRVTLDWIDAATGVDLGSDVYYVPAGGPGTSFTVFGRGPSRASQVKVTFTNLDPAQATAVTWTMIQSSRIYPRDFWHWNNRRQAAGTIPGWTLPVLPYDTTSLGFVDNIAIAANTTLTYLFGMWDGLIQMGGVVITGTPASLSITVRPQPNSEYAANAITSSGDATTINRQFAGARAPLRVDLANSSASAVTIALGLWAIR